MRTCHRARFLYANKLCFSNPSHTTWLPRSHRELILADLLVCLTPHDPTQKPRQVGLHQLLSPIPPKRGCAATDACRGALDGPGRGRGPYHVAPVHTVQGRSAGAVPDAHQSLHHHTSYAHQNATVQSGRNYRRRPTPQDVKRLACNTRTHGRLVRHDGEGRAAACASSALERLSVSTEMCAYDWFSR